MQWVRQRPHSVSHVTLVAHPFLRAVFPFVDTCVWQFVNFHFQHQTLLFPAFIVQRTVQEKIFGLAFWKGKSNENPAKAIKHGERRFDRRHVQSILRTYKTGSAAAILTHTGDPNEGLREWMEKAKNPEAVDPEAVRKEIEARRGSKLTLIAEWRRRVNPKKREEYKQQLLVDAKARREREKREKEEKKKLQELMNDKKNQVSERRSNDGLPFVCVRATSYHNPCRSTRSTSRRLSV